MNLLCFQGADDPHDEGGSFGLLERLRSAPSLNGYQAAASVMLRSVEHGFLRGVLAPLEALLSATDERQGP